MLGTGLKLTQLIPILPQELKAVLIFVFNCSVQFAGHLKSFVLLTKAEYADVDLYLRRIKTDVA